MGSVPFFSRENEEVCLEEVQPKRDQCCWARSTGLPLLSPMLSAVQSPHPTQPSSAPCSFCFPFYSLERGKMQNLSKEIFIAALRYFKMSTFLSNFSVFLPIYYYYYYYQRDIEWKEYFTHFFVWRVLRVGVSFNSLTGCMNFPILQFCSHWVTVICLHQINVDGFLSELFLALNKTHWM